MATATLAAPGRRARTVTRPSCTCAPSRECGSWCAPPMSRSSSSLPAGRAVGAAPFFRGAAFAVPSFLAGLSLTTSPHQPLDGAKRYREPGRSVTCLVDDLVDVLAELQPPQEHRVLPRIAPACAGIAVTEGVSIPFCPFVGAIREARVAGLLGQQVLRCVVERAQHARDVTQRAHQRDPLRQRPGRLTLEVDDLPAVLDT